MIKEYKFHEAAAVFPLESYDDLAADIRKRGQQVPIELLDGEILDGRRRYLACQLIGIEPRFIRVNIDDPMAVLDHVISLNLNRRQLDYGGRALAAGRADGLREKYEKAKGRQKSKATPGRSATRLVRDILGQKFGITGRTIESSVRIIKRGTLNLQAAVASNLIPISTAAEVASLPEDGQNALVEKVRQAKDGGGTHSARGETRRNNNKIPHGLIGAGVIIANEAINCLKRIPKDDPLRDNAFKMIIDWIKYNK